MKNKEYVEKYGWRLASGDCREAARELIEDFIREFNAEARRLKIQTEAEQMRLIERVNRKGNELAGMLLVKKGVMILRRDWFRGVAMELMKEGVHGGKDDEAEV